MSSIDVPDELMARLIRAANRRGYKVDENDQSQLANYIAYLLYKDAEQEPFPRRKNTLPLASGLLLRSDRPDPTDAEIGAWLDERRMHK